MLAAAVSTEARTAATLFTLTLILGVSLGAATKTSGDLSGTWAVTSNYIGWTYFAAWSLSFWPQVLQNAQRGRVDGLSFDFLALNLLGFSCYSAFNCALYYSPVVRAQYVAHYGKKPGVASNDVFFSLHAVFATLVSIVQCAVLPRGEGQRVSRLGAAVLASLVSAVVVYAAVVAAAAGAADAGAGGRATSWLAFLTFVSYVKLSISLMKYIPQAVLNARNKSTAGWSIHNIMLDFTGGALSVLQNLGDASQIGWSAVIGDPVKFGLGFVSMVFDAVFFTQHYCLYAKRAERMSDVDSDGNALLFADGDER
jgi:cystinosin